MLLALVVRCPARARRVAYEGLLSEAAEVPGAQGDGGHGADGAPSARREMGVRMPLLSPAPCGADGVTTASMLSERPVTPLRRARRSMAA